MMRSVSPIFHFNTITTINTSHAYLDICTSNLLGTSVLLKSPEWDGMGGLKPHKVKTFVRTRFVTVRPRLTKLFSTAEKPKPLSIILSQRSPEPGLDDESNLFNQPWQMFFCVKVKCLSATASKYLEHNIQQSEIFLYPWIKKHERSLKGFIHHQFVPTELSSPPVCRICVSIDDK